MRRKLIEVSLPLNSLNVAAQKDKNPFLKGHPRSLHLWWSRKPLAVCRAILFASLVDDPSSRPELFSTVSEQTKERERLLSFMESLIEWSGSDNQILDLARHEIGKYTEGVLPPIYDPFAGGGSIPLEAKRLGLQAHGSDINPLAVIINKALIEIPERFGDSTLLPKAIRHYGQWMQQRAKEKLQHLYPSADDNVLAFLYCRSVKCPSEKCDADVPLISKYWLCTKKGKQAWLKPIMEEGKFHFEILTGQVDEKSNSSLASGTRMKQETGKVAKAAFVCLFCQTSVKGKYIHDEAEKGRLGFIPLAKVFQNKRGRKYLPFTKEEWQVTADNCRHALDEYSQIHAIPNERARGTFASNAQGRSYGFKTFADYFLPRQLLALCVLSDLIEEAREDALQCKLWTIADDGVAFESGGSGLTAFADAVATYLAFAVNHLVRYSTLLNPWNTTNQNVAQIFGRQAMQMTWDFAEANILDGSLTIEVASEWVAAALDNLPKCHHLQGPSSIRQLNSIACQSPTTRPVIITDPPYYNYVSYADLSDFFYVWLKRSLSGIHRDLLKDNLAPKGDELVVTPHRFDGNEGLAKRHFIDGLTQSFTGMHGFANSEFPIAVFYAFNPKEIEQLANKDTQFDFSGWEAMLESLISSDWMLTACWTLATERKTRMVARGTKALASSLLLVLRKRPQDAQLIRAKELSAVLSAELPAAIAELECSNIAAVDRLQLSLIEGAKILSRYRAVIQEDGSTLPVSEAIKLVISQLFAKVT